MIMEDKKLNDYVSELLLWNKNFNLIGRSTENDIWETHIENSLELLKFLKQDNCQNIIDIGSGAGLPSIPLAIFLNEKSFFLTETNLKKIAFLTFVAKKLKLNNIKVININEGFKMENECIVTSRAFATLTNILKWEKKHLQNVKKNFILKGREDNIKKELYEAKIENYEIFHLKKGNLVVF